MATRIRMPPPVCDPGAEAALLSLLRRLAARGYRFVTPTPATHGRVLARHDRRVAESIEDALGWSLPFAAALLDSAMLADLTAADAIEPAEGGLLRSRVRVSSLQGCLFLHSAYPTDAADSVFFGPDSYRFADAIAVEVGRAPLPAGAAVLDIGAGAGVGGVVAVRLSPGAHAVLTDINPQAIRLARINARAAAVAAECLVGEAPPEGPFDLVVANPPYMIDAERRDYRDGGAMHGGEVAVAMTRDALARLKRDGRFLLYTGSAIVRGEDRLCGVLAALAAQRGWTMRYREIDPDVFGEELDKPAYREVDRIAAVGAVFSRA